MITFARLHGCLVGGALGDALGYPLGVSPDPEAYPPHDGRFVPLSHAR